MILGLIAAVILAQGSVVKSLSMVVLGLLLGIVGIDPGLFISRFAVA